MEVLAVKHRIEGENLKEYFSVLKNALIRASGNHEFDLVVGPDYALQSFKDGKVDVDKYRSVIDELSKISSSHRGVVFLPGTLMKPIDSRLVSLVAPVFIDGNMSNEFYKETDSGEEEYAKAIGFKYSRGNSRKNHFELNGEEIAVEICSDHGKQAIPKNTFLDVILAYDRFGGFSPKRMVEGNHTINRYGLVSNSFNGNVEMQKYLYNEDLRFIEPIANSQTFALFSIA